MKQLTIRGVPEKLVRALEVEKRKRGSSLNQLVLDLLNQVLCPDQDKNDNGLSKFAGTWSNEELAEFEKNTVSFEQIDEETWK